MTFLHERLQWAGDWIHAARWEQRQRFRKNLSLAEESKIDELIRDLQAMKDLAKEKVA